ncbi:hypothetical protein [Rufibacter tibetensis]|nr:hypothetical protein [Rufibacter tibetensis]
MMNRSVKITDATDEHLETLKMLLSRKVKKKVTKGQIITWSLKTLTDKLKAMQEGNEDGEA